MTQRAASLNEMSEMARGSIREVMLREKLSVPPAVKSTLVFGEGLDDQQGYFTVYIPGPTPEQAVVLVSATVNRASREIDVVLTKELREVCRPASS